MNDAVRIEVAECEKSAEERLAQDSPALERAWETAARSLTEEYTRKTVFNASLY
jgi:hypothetical protein